MQYAILGDIHANLAALEAVLESLENEVIDQILQVGDVVGYGAAPAESIELLRERDAMVVKGNHDAACAGELDTRLFNPNARAAVDFTRAELSRDDLQWLANLPLLHATDDCVLAHSTLPDPDRFDYIQSTSEADPSLDALDRPVAFLGHTHVPRHDHAAHRFPGEDVLHHRPRDRPRGDHGGARERRGAWDSPGTRIVGRPTPSTTQQPSGSSCAGSTTTSSGKQTESSALDSRRCSRTALFLGI